MSSPRAHELAKAAADRLATDQMSPQVARLYSQHTKLRNRQVGLSSWSDDEANRRLQDAVELVTISDVLRENGDPRWRLCLIRCGELLEWLSHSAIGLDNVPTELLSAACYDLAGYPARAHGLLSSTDLSSQSEILRSFLSGNLLATFKLIHQYWETKTAQTGVDSAGVLAETVVEEVIRALGVVCASQRWAEEPRLVAAIEKLQHVAVLHAGERDEYSWLLAKLTAGICRDQSSVGWRPLLSTLASELTEGGRTALDRYCRLAFTQSRSRAWPSQKEGIERLMSGESFALCTPTGSGKTSVAEVALLEAIFRYQEASSEAPLSMYLVPSRALAAEVEGKLTQILSRTARERIVVTGLYGGTDWGPTDAWLTSDDPTVVICTYEKAEALIRFIGPIMLPRLRLVIFDEAHAVQFDRDMNALRQAENRSLRLESLGLRIAQMVDPSQCRRIALSAVAAGMEDSLHRWVSNNSNGTAARVSYQSTRQLIGRLTVSPNGDLSIQYDILDGNRLNFADDAEATPYVPNALPASPITPSSWTGPEKSLRPALFWAALHLSAPDEQGINRAVLISVAQGISGFAKDFLELIERHWVDIDHPSAKRDLSQEQQTAFDETLRVCEDYFGTESYEYRLLQHGIAIHHSSMPKLLARRITELIHGQAVTLMLATSTLSEGVNIPVETILVPSVFRGQSRMQASEFRNLAGRAGRPGVAAEGRTLVVLPRRSHGRPKRQEIGYRDLLNEVLQIQPTVPTSPLGSAINDLWNEWQRLTNGNDFDDFLDWLEKVNLRQSLIESKYESLDSIDSVLLSGIAELEELSTDTLWEDRLQAMWNSTYGAHLATEQQRLAFIRRGVAIPDLYPEQSVRRNIYRTGLPPSTAFDLIESYAEIAETLSSGSEYAKWSSEEQFEYVVDCVIAVSTISRFRAPDELSTWSPILRWWLWPEATGFPAANKVAVWHRYIGTYFNYRFCWGLGSIIGYAFDLRSEAGLQPSSLELWDEIGLPWIVFWLKELVSWGSLDPVVTFLLARGLEATRSDAKASSASYYESEFAGRYTEVLDPRAIREWTESVYTVRSHRQEKDVNRQFDVMFEDANLSSLDREFRVIPVFREDKVLWMDIAGYDLASSAESTAEAVAQLDMATHDFVLHTKDSIVTVQPYL